MSALRIIPCAIFCIVTSCLQIRTKLSEVATGEKPKLARSEFALQFGTKRDSGWRIYKIDQVKDHGWSYQLEDGQMSSFVVAMDGTTLRVYCNKQHIFSSPTILLEGYQVSIFAEGSVEIHRPGETKLRKIPPNLEDPPSSESSYDLFSK